ncbi:hypothetical protein [Polaromonas sp. DSR2-3-2]|uniref:hypothetical protein n=1 Tax=unclassified Polaromonas TaxID=2638319 RepID=UPI003CF90D0F
MKSVPATATNKIKSAGKPVVIAKKKSMAVKLVKKNSVPTIVSSAAVQGPLDRPHHGVRATDVGLGVLEIEDSVFFELVEHDKVYCAMIVEMIKHLRMVQGYDAVHIEQGYNTMRTDAGWDRVRSALTEKALDKMVVSILSPGVTEPFSIKEAFEKPLDYSKISDLADFNFDCINVLRRAAA